MVRRTFILSLITALVLSATPATVFAQDRGTPAPKKSQPSATNPVNLNTATSVELEALPGVGAAMAARIIEYRQKNGGFKKIEDLMNVKGIGEKAFLKLKPLVTVAPPKVADR
jgi:competence protein ComEA